VSEYNIHEPEVLVKEALTMSNHLLVLTTVGSESDAVNLAKALVERRIVACANIVGPVRSFYHWEGSLSDDFECLLLLKTRTDRYPDLERAIGELHPYDVPELIGVPIERGASSYLNWVDENVRS
jgi:periplasmic divalent cation tolerance protein